MLKMPSIFCVANVWEFEIFFSSDQFWTYSTALYIWTNYCLRECSYWHSIKLYLAVQQVSSSGWQGPLHCGLLNMPGDLLDIS